ncbi:MAG: PP2C family protein-serine/threonine phosphatase [Actinomycetes bacterium]
MPLSVRPGPARGILACLMLCAAIVVGDIAHGTDKSQYVGVLTAVPFLAATFAGPVAVVAVGAVAWLAGAVIGLTHDDGQASAQVVRLSLIAVATVLAAVAARSRLNRERRLVAVQSAADAASRAILRPLPPVVAGVPLAVDYVSAFEQARVGGDLYEAVDTAYGLRVVVGDVRGKGLDAVRLAAVALGSFREAAHREPDLDAVAAAMHAAVGRDADPEDFVTALLLEVRAGCVRMLSCGHPHPLVVRGGRARVVDMPSGPPLGIGRATGPTEVSLRPGDRLLLYTDGAVEARRGGVFFPLDEAAADTLSQGPLRDGLTALSKRLRAFAGPGPGDDVAFLVLEMPPR